MSSVGTIIRVAGPVVQAEGMRDVKMYELVSVGKEGLIGEVIRIQGDVATIQVYEDTSGVRPGEKVYGSGMPLYVELGPGLIGTIYDGIQRPLSDLMALMGHFVKRGVKAPPLPRDKKWHFKPRVKKGDKAFGGQVIGVVQETPLIEHRILVPPNVHGEYVEVISEGDYTVEEVVAVVETETGKEELKMYHRWPVRQPRPYQRRLELDRPMLTGQRVIDTFFPVAKGGAVAIPGGFGTGKTITLHQLAAWSDADVIIYIGCGERGNEMTEVLISFPELKDPRTGRPLMERTVLVANTSNMPVSAREASIYTGVTIAEYFRDMGYDAAVMADSTSRWAEALREISGRLEEMPAEEGFPSYLPSRLGEFYERAGRVVTLNGATGSVTLIGAVSPPGGDFSEPVTVHTKRFIRAFWALDSALASMRHYPAINWLLSYSDYLDAIEPWWNERTGGAWRHYRLQAMKILQREDELKEIVRLLGPEAIPDSEKLILEIARLIREGFLQQNAYDPIDTYSTPEKQFKLLKAIIDFYEHAKRAISRGVPFHKIQSLPVLVELSKMRMSVPNDRLELIDEIYQQAIDALSKLERGEA
ncbi:MAG: V-type ATP synthase subunit A [Candidatus Methanomethylicota archaeon]|uniref:A-type ATP synthase subunit A n=1 Tax=Thermoproteota archaeon TaxID=2056631 RepID=A0A497F2F9_9CREN|nr:MAG: V-type ATP synthase subunit A [Candidatus Verstraetearchaeota archaeon]